MFAITVDGDLVALPITDSTDQPGCAADQIQLAAERHPTPEWYAVDRGIGETRGCGIQVGGIGSVGKEPAVAANAGEKGVGIGRHICSVD